MKHFFEMLWGVMTMLWYLFFNKEEARQYDYDCGFGEIEDER
jgi:hypothetical protein